jgi:hypothetical protein
MRKTILTPIFPRPTVDKQSTPEAPEPKDDFSADRDDGMGWSGNGQCGADFGNIIEDIEDLSISTHQLVDGVRS